MKLVKAIKILNTKDYPNLIVLNEDFKFALKLGIEALKREQVNRGNPDYVFVGPLPSETGGG